MNVVRIIRSVIRQILMTEQLDFDVCGEKSNWTDRLYGKTSTTENGIVESLSELINLQGKSNKV